MSIWEQNKNRVHQIDKSLTKRQSKWILICSECQNEREATYCQAWNIIKLKSSDKCRSCLIRLKILIPKTSHLKEYQHRNITRVSSSGNSKICLYRNLFDQPNDKPEVRIKQRLAKLGKCGPDANAYVDGRTTENRRLRSSDRYKQLHKEILRRDDFTCRICSVRGGKLEMDHIKEWCNYPELRFEESNCRTLCRSCHEKTDNYKTKAIKNRAA